MGNVVRNQSGMRHGKESLRVALGKFWCWVCGRIMAPVQEEIVLTVPSPLSSKVSCFLLWSPPLQSSL